jgi:hypothetical protein
MTDDDDDLTFDRFLSAALREPFTTAAREFRDKIRAEEDGRLETPSAEAADRRARKTRLRFATEVVEQVASTTPEQHDLWSLLSPDSQDEYLCRLFLPLILGGLYGNAIISTTSINGSSDDGGSSDDCAFWDDLDVETDDDDDDDCVRPDMSVEQKSGSVEQNGGEGERVQSLEATAGNDEVGSSP